MMSKYYWQNIKGQPKIMINKISLGFLLLIAFTTNLNAQCAMCKAAVEADLKEGGSAGAGLNEGILYLMAMPYIAIFLFGVLYYFQKRKKQKV